MLYLTAMKADLGFGDSGECYPDILNFNSNGRFEYNASADCLIAKVTWTSIVELYCEWHSYTQGIAGSGKSRKDDYITGLFYGYNDR